MSKKKQCYGAWSGSCTRWRGKTLLGLLGETWWIGVQEELGLAHCSILSPAGLEGSWKQFAGRQVGLATKLPQRTGRNYFPSKAISPPGGSL